MSSQLTKRTQVKVIIDFLLIAVGIVIAYLSLDLPQGSIMTGIALGVGFCGVLLLIYDTAKPQALAKMQSQHHEQIQALALVNEEGGLVREWPIIAQNGLLIGKSSGEFQADIDLSECTYEALISSQHALLNYADGAWYIEDCDSKNGVSLKKASDGLKYQLSKEKPCKLHKGDIIFIANTQLLLK